MNFWEAQRKARSRTSLYLISFVLLTVGMALLIDYVVRILARNGYTQPMPYLGLIFLALTFIVSGFYYLMYKGSGGRFVAESLGGREVTKENAGPREHQLLNIVEEMAVASGQPMPPVFIIESQQINAFAAGIKPDNAAITVTRGAMNLLNRDELQGVVAHEFGHIYNADMKISMRLAAMIMGLVFILYIGMRLLTGSMLFGGRNSNGGRGNILGLVAIVFLVAGSITWLGGAILRSMVSRQREYLADACAVQFTRNPSGIANALRKIASVEQANDMPKSGMAYAHLYFDNHSSFFSSIFATHPPLKKRIEAIEGKTYMPDEWPNPKKDSR